MVSGKRSENPTWRRHFTRIFFRRLSVGLSVLRVPEVKWDERRGEGEHRETDTRRTEPRREIDGRSLTPFLHSVRTVRDEETTVRREPRHERTEREGEGP